jgi:TonB-linked SusC/RagA family outer membrane protein
MRKLGSLITLFLLVVTSSALAQQRTVTGQVLDDVTGEEISFPQVTVDGTTVGTVGGEDGRFTLQVPQGAVRLIVQRIGYRSLIIDVDADQQVVDVSLTVDYLRVEELVVTGRATETRRVNLANSIGTVDGTEMNQVPQETIDKAITGRVAGAVISQNSGAPGGGLQLNIRGSASINANAEPLYVIDGVIVSNVAIPSNQNEITSASGGSNPSLDQDVLQNRIADINPEDIETIEVLKGASAAAIYGSKASNGVVIITTRQGEGPNQVRLAFQGGAFDLSNKLGSRIFDTQEEAVGAFGAAAGVLCTSSPCPIFDNEEALAGRNAFSWQGDIQVSGGQPGSTTYFGSGQWRDDQGIITNTGFQRGSGRLNVNTVVGGVADFSFNTNLLRTNASRGITNNGNNSISYYMVFPFTPSFIDLTADQDGVFPKNGAVLPDGTESNFVQAGSNPLQTAALVENNETVWRLIGSMNMELSLVDNAKDRFQIIAPVGVDFFSQTNRIYSPPDVFWEPVDGLLGTALDSNSDALNINAGGNGVWTHQFSGSQLTSAVGVQYEYRDLQINRTIGRNLTAGKDKTDAATQTQIIEQRAKVEDFGFYIQEEWLGLDNRLLLTGMVRFDQSSANGETTKLFIFPKGAASFRILEGNDPGNFFSEVKVRAAYGQSGNQPLCDVREGCQKFTSLRLDVNLEGQAGTVLEGTAGSPFLAPERSAEFEAGIDITGLNDRLTMEFTGSVNNITNIILERTVAPSTGFADEIANQATLRNTGFETTIGWTPFVGSDFTWLSRTIFYFNKSEVRDLQGLAPFEADAGFGLVLGGFFIQEGESLTQIVGTDVTCTGNPAVDEAVPGTEACLATPEFGGTGIAGQRKAGDSEPTFLMSFVNDFTIAGNLNLYTMFDWRYGADIVNLTELLYDFGANSADWNDQDGTIQPVQECNPNCSGEERLPAFGSQAYPWTQAASFFRARDISLTYSLPASWASAFFNSKQIRFRLAARNLFTITNYKGLDPEVSNFGNQNVGRAIDVAPFPPSRSVWLGFDITL